MNIRDVREFLGEDFNFQDQFLRFKSDILNAGFIDNEGGMDFVEGAWLYLILSKIKPQIFIECGVWRGFSSWIYSQVNNYGGSHFLFDPGFSEKGFNDLLKYKVSNGKYFSEDFGSTCFSGIAKNTTIFFDDHQDCLERLILSYSRGAKFAIFDDNYFYGGGGHNSLMDHFRDGNNSDLFDVIVRNIYMIPPLFSVDKGRSPVFTEDDPNFDFFTRLDGFNDSGYKWLTLVELNKCSTSPKSQGQFVF